MKVQQKVPEDIQVIPETHTIAVVVCKKCGEQIGRLQTIPAEPEADQEEIYAELRLIADEHRPMCPGGSHK
jgi:hypothetical protein